MPSTKAASGALLLALMGCAADAEPGVPFSDDYVVTRLAPDPVTELGFGLTEHRELPEVDTLLRFFEAVRCDGVNPLLLRLSGERFGTRAEGRFDMFLADWDEGSGDPCVDGTFGIQPVFAPGRAAPFGGPLYMDGVDGDSRVTIRIDYAMAETVAPLLVNFLRVSFEARPATYEVTGGRMSAIWSARYFDRVSTGEGAPTFFDVVVAGAELQPDVDEDSDGLERFHDDDGDGFVDRCVDGDGREVLGVDCVRTPGFNDAYALEFLFRLRPL